MEGHEKAKVKKSHSGPADVKKVHSGPADVKKVHSGQDLNKADHPVEKEEEDKKDGGHHHHHHHHKNRPHHRTYDESEVSDKHSSSESLAAKYESRPEYRILQKTGYQIKKQIGSGSYARVYRVREIATKKDFAVKVIHPSKHSRQYRNKMLPRELLILAKIHHKNIIKVKKIYSDKNHDTILIVMTFATHGTLHDYLDDKGPLKESEAKKFFLPICQAVQFMHNLPDPVAHRDLKLDNILLDANNEPKLTDFSYTRFCTDVADPKSGHIMSTTYCGTEPYLAPEVLLEKPYDPIPADVWSLGVCLFMLLNEKYPFKGDHRAIRKQALNKEWGFQKSIKDKLTPGVKDLVTKMLEPDPKKRITINEVMKHSWINV